VSVTLDRLMSDPQRSALLIIDMQNDFLLPGAPVPTVGGLQLVPAIAALAREARLLGLPVVFTQEMHRTDHSDFGIELAFETPHCYEGTPGMDLVEGLEPEPGDVRIMGKRRYDAFLGTDLDLALRVRGVENLLVTGVCTDICVLCTVHHARNLDYRCFVLSDAVAGTTEERHWAALTCIDQAFGHVGTVAEVAPAFGLQAAVAAAERGARSLAGCASGAG
jgi:nicotinamidase-related amidase